MTTAKADQLPEIEDWDGAPISFRITSYFKRTKATGPGLTQRGSRRLDAAETITWILNELPEAATIVDVDHEARKTTVVFDLDMIERVSPRPTRR
jgi:hypothetical protein